MLSNYTKFLIIILAWLQLIAPLVHAHVAEEHPNLEFHLPGLEHYSIKYKTTPSHTYISTHYSESTVICVSAGIKQNKVSTNKTEDIHLTSKYFSDKSFFFLSRIIGFHQPTVIARKNFLQPPSRASPSFH